MRNCFVLSLMILALVLTPKSLEAQDLSRDVGQWLSGAESVEFHRVIEKLTELLELNSSATKGAESPSSSLLPPELQGLVTGSSELDFKERQQELLYGSESELGLLELTQQLKVSEYNKLLLVGTMIYQQDANSRWLVGQWFEQMEALFKATQERENHSPGYRMAQGALEGLSLFLAARTVQALWKNPLRKKTGTALTLAPTANLPAVVPQGALAQVKRYLSSRQGLILLHTQAMGLGAAYGGVQSYLYTLQTKKVSPGELLRMIQADMACDLAHDSLALKTNLAEALQGSQEPAEWAELEQWTAVIEEAQNLNQELYTRFPELVSFWTATDRGWGELRQSLEAPLAPQETRRSCEQISTEVIALDLEQSKALVEGELRNKLLGFDSLYSFQVKEAHRELFKAHASWLLTQDDLLKKQPWLLSLLNEFMSERDLRF